MIEVRGAPKVDVGYERAGLGSKRTDIGFDRADKGSKRADMGVFGRILRSLVAIMLFERA